MAYNSVGTPRIYVNDFTYAKSLGIHELHEDTPSTPFEGNPTTITQYNTEGTNLQFRWQYKRFAAYLNTVPNYIAILGHNLSSSRVGVRHSYHDPDWEGWQGGNTIPDQIFNANIGDIANSSTYLTPRYDGCSIYGIGGADNSYEYGRFEFKNYDDNFSETNVKIGSIFMGRYYEFPHSPDLKLSISYETGTKEQTTKGGATLTNNMWGVVKWGDLAAWELSDPNGNTLNQNLSNQSRRIWDLSFSYLDKENTFPKYSALSTLGTSDETSTDPEQYTLEGDESFYSSVWNKVGTQYSFIFQPDSTEKSFAICKIDGNIKFTQVAHNIYNINLKIREVW